MLTIGKLALLASGTQEGALFDRVNKAIDLISYQEDVPEIVFKTFDYNVDTMRVLLPQEIIRVCIMGRLLMREFFDKSNFHNSCDCS